MHAHGHAPGGDEPDWDSELEMLERTGELNQPWVEQAAQWVLSLPTQAPVRRLVDAGSGPGHTACTFAELLPGATVTAFDATKVFLDRARERADRLGLGDRFAVAQGDLEADLDAVAPADLVWASRVLHHTDDPVASMSRLGRALSPGGMLAVVEGGLSMRVLPGGYGVASAGFAERLEAMFSDLAASHWSLTESATSGAEDWPVMMQAAGLQHAASKTFLLEYRAPVAAGVREHIVERFARLREAGADLLSGEDAAALDRLLDENDPAAFARRPDLFLLTAYTVHAARRPA